MGDYDFVDVGSDWVWVDTPGYEFVDESTAVVRLKHLQLKDVSTIYGCRIIVGGKIVNRDLEISLGAGNIIDLQLTAENADTGAVAPLTATQMATITNCKLALDGTVLDSSAIGGIGAGKPFDPVTNAANGVLSLTLGEQAITPKAYRVCRLAIQFSNTPLPKVINLQRRAIVFPVI